MNATYLAQNDGSVESSGRGSGLDTREDRSDLNSRVPRDSAKLPYGSMTFAPLERRLDSAIFRSLFASSARQARQFVVHGAVKVNGKKMRYPGYLLNPGDMFQVDPERVMFATGQTKQPLEAVEEAIEEGAEKEAATEDTDVSAKAAKEVEEVNVNQDPRDLLKDLLAQSRAILASPKEGLAAKRKHELRAFSIAVKKMLSRSKSSTILTDSLEAQFVELQNQLKIRRQKKESSLPSEQRSKDAESAAISAEASPPLDVAEAGEPAETVTGESYANNISDSEYEDLQAALLTMTENPVDDAKPYATPWMPRDYMSAFAFIPRYLEVNQNICAAVYLRHPVVRPGMAEVPSPFGEDVNSVAHTWYLRRR